MVISQLGLADIPDGGRLRIDDDNLGLKPPRKFVILLSFTVMQCRNLNTCSV